MSAHVYYADLKPADVDNKVWNTIIDAWTNGLSDRDGAFRASKLGKRITEADIKRWIKENPEIAELKEHLSADLVSKSKLVIADAIRDGDIKTAKWYLERKAPQEFSSKSAIAFENGVIELSLDEKNKAMNDLIGKYQHGEQ